MSTGRIRHLTDLARFENWAELLDQRRAQARAALENDDRASFEEALEHLMWTVEGAKDAVASSRTRRRR